MLDGTGFASYESKSSGDARPSLKARLEDYERSLIEGALSATGGNQRQAARRLGILPTTLHAKIRRLGIERPARSGAGATPQEREAAQAEG
jgi:DNA-binding NtrC family response regulator